PRLLLTTVHMYRRRLGRTLFPYTTLFRSERGRWCQYSSWHGSCSSSPRRCQHIWLVVQPIGRITWTPTILPSMISPRQSLHKIEDRKSTRLNSSHVKISYAVFCLKKKK